MATILLVDDYPRIREFFSEELSDSGHIVFGLGETESILKYLYDFKIDLVLLEPFLGKIDRLDILSEIKHDVPQMPIILVN